MSRSDAAISLLSASLSVIAIASILQHMMKERSSEKEGEAQESTTAEHHGPWTSLGRKQKVSGRQSSPPLGPEITARLADNFCAINEVHLSRLPHGETGNACWSILLSTIHPRALSINVYESDQDRAAMSPNGFNDWTQLPLVPLVMHESQLCVKISRATLMTLFALTNARPIYSYSSAAGYRSAYPSYCGQWTISWPIGKPCVVRLAPHDSHNAATDVYPLSFPARVDKCVELLAGVISHGAWKIAFPGRAKHVGPWVLQERPKGFGGAHGSRHLYNMQGGKVFEVDLLVLVPCQAGDQDHTVKLQVPCLGKEGDKALIYLPKDIAKRLARSLDCLPWSSLSWSLHRGLRDVLLAYGKTAMDRYRVQVASSFAAGVSANRVALLKRGWAPELVDGPMASMAESAILSGSGNSGDVVRIVVAIMECLLETAELVGIINLDVTDFWSWPLEHPNESRCEGSLAGVIEDMDMFVALTRFFVLEWSQDLDYQLYHDLPIELLLA